MMMMMRIHETRRRGPPRARLMRVIRVRLLGPPFVSLLRREKQTNTNILLYYIYVSVCNYIGGGGGPRGAASTQRGRRRAGELIPNFVTYFQFGFFFRGAEPNTFKIVG